MTQPQNNLMGKQGGRGMRKNERIKEQKRKQKTKSTEVTVVTFFITGRLKSQLWLLRAKSIASAYSFIIFFSN